MSAIHPSFAVAAHSYFVATNKAEQSDLFLSGQQEQPYFTYRGMYKAAMIDERICQVGSENPRWRRSLELVRCSVSLQHDASYVSEFRDRNVQSYGEPKRQYAAAILNRMAGRVTSDSQQLWHEIEQLLPDDYMDAAVFMPAKDTFERYRTYMMKYIAEFPEGVDLSSALNRQLAITKLDRDGWSVSVRDGAMPARTHHRSKKISIGREYRTRSRQALRRIVVHEVYGHALRGQQESVAEAEGFAIMLEQLCDPAFRYRRSYRYLAIALGWGVFGTHMTFRQVHEIMWRAMIMGNKYYTEERAKRYAFEECYRAFRGGRPDIAGAVYLKDSCYFAANIAVWEMLVNSPLNYDEFIDCIEGRRTVLS